MACNGWTNKETWLVNLWLGDTLDSMREDGEEITPDYVESLVDEIVGEDSKDNFVKDLLNCALGKINYHEIASHYQESF